MLKLNGLITATHTPFDSNGEINTDVIPEYIDYLANENLTGVFTCGTTGESASLTTDERKCLAENFAKATNGKLKHVVHVGHNSIKTACELAEHAQTIKADAISAYAPSYFKVNDTDTLVACCKEIADSAPQTPFYYYNIPCFTNSNLSMLEFLEKAENVIPNLAGIKFTHFDMMDFQLCQDYSEGKFNLLFGRDEYYLASLAFGAVGAVGSTYNFMAPTFHAMTDAFKCGDLLKAQQMQLTANKIICYLAKYGGFATGKAFLRMRGIDTGPCRLPNNTLKKDIEIEIYEEASKILHNLQKPF